MIHLLTASASKRADRRFRFAPTPSHDLHVGNGLAALIGWATARLVHGAFVLRVEDIDQARCTPAYESSCLDDLRWLGIDWDEGPDVGGSYGPYRQSERMSVYDARLQHLRSAGWAYPCVCSRADIRQAQSAPAPGRERPYPGTCRLRGVHHGATDDGMKGLRLHVCGLGHRARVSAVDGFMGPHFEDVRRTCGDFLLGRPNAPTYQLAVVADDMAMEITDVVRGRDLVDSTARQRLLHVALGARPPRFYHHPLITNAEGRKLSKRDRSVTLASFRSRDGGPQRLIALLGRLVGLFQGDVHQATAGDLRDALCEAPSWRDGAWPDPGDDP